MEGEGEINIDFIKSLRAKNPQTKIVPRMYMSASEDNIYQVLDMRDEQNIYDILDFVKRVVRWVNFIINCLKEYKFNIFLLLFININRKN